MIPAKIYALVGLPYMWAVGEMVAPKGDPYGAIAAILTGSLGLGLVSLYQRFRMAALAVDAESRRVEMAGLNERLDAQDDYIHSLEDKLRDVSREAERWKTMYSQIQPSSPRPSEPR